MRRKCLFKKERERENEREREREKREKERKREREKKKKKRERERGTDLDRASAEQLGARSGRGVGEHAHGRRSLHHHARVFRARNVGMEWKRRKRGVKGAPEWPSSSTRRAAAP